MMALVGVVEVVIGGTAMNLVVATVTIVDRVVVTALVAGGTMTMKVETGAQEEVEIHPNAETMTMRAAGEEGAGEKKVPPWKRQQAAAPPPEEPPPPKEEKKEAEADDDGFQAVTAGRKKKR